MTLINPQLPETVYAIQHLAFEDLGALEDVFYQYGYRVRYFDAGVDDLTTALAYDGLVVILGGPIGVYEQDDYPFLIDEISGLRERLAANKPTLGICLGAQLIAHVLGAPVYAGHAKEIGWSSLTLSQAVDNPLATLGDTTVLHWHGDTFDLPAQAELLASSALYPNQAFKIGDNILALQFHIEVAEEDLEKWLIGHTCELRKANISIPELRQDNQKYASKLMSKSAEVLKHYVTNLKI